MDCSKFLFIFQNTFGHFQYRLQNVFREILDVFGFFGDSKIRHSKVGNSSGSKIIFLCGFCRICIFLDFFCKTMDIF